MSGKHCEWTEKDSENAAIDEALRENIRKGWLEVTGKNDKGEVLFRMTDAGIAHVRSLQKKPSP